MQISLCDSCGEPIKTNDKKWVLGINEVGETGDKEEKEKQFSELILSLQLGKTGNMGGLIIREICPKCMRIFLYFVNMRKEEIEKSKIEIDKILKMKFKEVKKEKEDNKGNK